MPEVSMLWLSWLTLAGAAELTCDLRGLSARITYDEAGEVVVHDGDEVLATAQTGPIALSKTRASCSGDRFRMVQESNTADDGSHAALSLGTLEMDLGPLLDTLPAERFDPRQSGLRKARRAASAGDWEGMEERLSTHLPLTDGERDRLVEVLLLEGSRAAVGHAWAMVDDGGSPLRRETGLTLLRMHIDAEDLAAVGQLALLLPNEPEACEWVGRVEWAKGKKGKARKTWATCRGLSEEVLAWCGSCS